MNSVFLVQHIHRLPSGEDDVKVIGVYRTEKSAREAVTRLSLQPGFSKLPAVVDYDQGFCIDEYKLDEDHWTEGYVTMVGDQELQESHFLDSHMPESHQDNLRGILERMPMSHIPAPWSVIGAYAVGGLTEVGFVSDTEDLLVVSTQGRGLFDTLSGEKVARDSEEFFENPDPTGFSAPGIGRASGSVVPLAGLHGGGLSRCTHDGWMVDIIQLPWPRHVMFLSSNFNPCYDEGNAWKICDDGACEYRMAGFSPSGRALVFATSCELVIYGRTFTE